MDGKKKISRAGYCLCSPMVLNHLSIQEYIRLFGFFSGNPFFPLVGLFFLVGVSICCFLFLFLFFYFPASSVRPVFVLSVSPFVPSIHLPLIPPPQLEPPSSSHPPVFRILVFFPPRLFALFLNLHRFILSLDLLQSLQREGGVQVRKLDIYWPCENDRVL